MLLSGYTKPQLYLQSCDNSGVGKLAMAGKATGVECNIVCPRVTIIAAWVEPRREIKPARWLFRESSNDSKDSLKIPFGTRTV